VTDVKEPGMERFVLAIDQGTTSSRAIVFDHRGAIRGVGQHPTRQIFPQPGWVNQDAEDLWETTCRAIADALDGAAIAADNLSAIGITNQRETTILWNRATGRPVAPAIVWQSRQTVPLVEAIDQRGRSATYQRLTGLVPDAFFSATKIAWLLDRDLELRRRAEAGDILFGTVETWLIWNLTGGKLHVTDVSNASRTMLFDIRGLGWSPELLADLDIPQEILPVVVPCSAVLGETDPSVLGVAIPITGSAGDQQAALFGQACFAPGQAKNTYGTGSFMLMNTGTDAVTSENRLLTTIAWRIGDVVDYALEGAVFITGAAVQWLRDGLGLIEKSSDVESLAASVPDSGGVVFVPALVGLGAPHWDAAARGTLLGLTRGATKAHIARATLDAIAFQTRDVLDAMTADCGISLTELRVDGGAARNDLLMQIQADALGVPVVRPRITETTALGAAYLAGLAIGVWEDRAELAGHWQVDRRFEPRLSESNRETHYQRWREAVERAKGWDYA
jgi:glycerol kinase